MEKETYIQEILNSSNGITKVNPKDDLFSKIEQRIQENKIVPLRKIWLVAASIVILVSINLSLLSNQNSKKEINTALGLSLNKSNQIY